MGKYRFYTAFVESLKQESSLNTLEPFTPIDGAFSHFKQDRWLTFCSHDYLGLATHPEVKKGAMRKLLEYGITTTSECRNLYTHCQQKLEEKLCEVLQRPAALLFASRFDANVTTLSALGHEKAAFFLDEKSHLSLFRGAHESVAAVQTYRDPAHLEALLQANGCEDKIVITESVFSINGDVAPLMKLIEIAKNFHAILYVDDSHGFGVMGPEGYGLCAHLKDVGIISGSFSKACGAYGGFVACPKVIREYLIHTHPRQAQYLFPPPLIGALESALELIGQLEGERKQLQQRSHWLRQTLAEMGFSLSMPNTPLISLSFENKEDAESLYTLLQDEQILIGPIRSSVTKPVSYRLNLVLNIDHRPDHLNRLLEVIKSWQKSAVTLEFVAKC